MRVLIIDNYDSFVYNLAQYVGELGATPIVHRNDAISLRQAKSLDPDRVVISPGPGNPQDPKYFGVCREILLEMGPSIPILGVCLGHQGIGSTFGASIRRASSIKHGKTSMISHDGKGVLRGVAQPFEATRYHSLVVEEKSLPRELLVTARATDDGEIMGMRHSEFPVEGVQFHPESIITHEGKKIVKNFLDEGVRH